MSDAQARLNSEYTSLCARLGEAQERLERLAAEQNDLLKMKTQLLQDIARVRTEHANLLKQQADSAKAPESQEEVDKPQS